MQNSSTIVNTTSLVQKNKQKKLFEQMQLVKKGIMN